MAKLMKIAEGGLDEYYYYYGSLTFPANSLADYPTHSCAEIVTWILPTKKLTISPAQLADFQKIMFTAVGQLNNNRLIQTGTSISGSYRRLGDSISGIDWINSLISSIMNTGPRSLSSSGNPVFIRRVDQPSSYTTEETAVQYARAGVAAVTSIAATSLISSPPDLGGELTNICFERHLTDIEIPSVGPRSYRRGHASSSTRIFEYSFKYSFEYSFKYSIEYSFCSAICSPKCALNWQRRGQFK